MLTRTNRPSTKPRSPIRRARLALAVAVVLALSVGIGVSSGAIPSGGGTIFGCLANSDGGLRVIDEARQPKCASGEQALDWNQKGVPGAPGPVGAPGLKGDRGAAGSLHLVTRRQRTTIEPGQTIAVDAVCLPAERVVSGGYVTSGTPRVSQDFPQADGRTWSVRYENEAAVPTDVSTFARCAA